MSSEKKNLIGIDGNSLLHRAFYALPDMTARDGTPTGALHGFFSMLFKLLQRQPDYLFVAFDLHGPTFRHERFSDYKAGRRETPEDLRIQFPILKELLKEMDIAVLECPRYEADDILGTMSLRCEDAGVDALIVTGDRDALQLVSDKTHVLMTKKGISEAVEYTPAVLLEQYGLTPAHMRDLKGLMGDSSDNIPGIPGVGEKTALKLLGEYGDLESVLSHGGEIKGKLGERVRENVDSARLSFWLGTIDRNVPLDDSAAIACCAFHPDHLSKAAARLRALDLRMIAAKIPESTAQPELEAAPEYTCVPIDSEETLQGVIRTLGSPKQLAVALDGGISFATTPETAYVLTAGETLFDTPLERSSVLLALSPWLSDPEIEKLTFDAKALAHAANACGATLQNVTYDAMLVDYLLDAIQPARTLSQLAERTLGRPVAAAADLFTLSSMQTPKLASIGMNALYRDMELPLSSVLLDMEREGFRVDEHILKELSDTFDARISELQKEIYSCAGETFNILSPKQLGMILFEKLGLPTQRKTKSGYSTDSDALEKLKEGNPIVGCVLEYRFLTKLKSTYLDGLLAVRNATDGRVRTRFNQCLTATGRISSAEPNLQNIPVRAPLGREIRRAFCASEGCVLVDADYSQIELRILAHLSGDEHMIEAFCSGDDIHRRTAGEVFGTPFAEVTPEMRSAAKAVNFGIVYGISDFGLANNLGIPVKRASEYIRMYFDRYPKVEEFMKRCVEEGKLRGYAVTMFGRRRALPELNSANYNTRSFGERVAMNMPIQGSAADIIKLAMVNVSRRLAAEGFSAKLILQVHDELIFDTPATEAERLVPLVHDCMEHICELSVPLEADVKTGHSWYDTK